MATARTIVGIGEVMVADVRGDISVTGLAARMAMEAARFGHRGIAVSRLGQDDDARLAIDQLRDTGVDVAHLQSDPDHATGRVTIRSIMGRTSQQMSGLAAFDYLQWDYDLDDIAQVADMVCFGCLARRTALARSTIERMLGVSNRALRVFDLTSRPFDDDLGSVNPDAGLRYADLIIVDELAVRSVWPSGRQAPVDSALRAMMRHHDVHGAMVVKSDQPTRLLTADELVEGATAWPDDHMETAMMACLLTLLGGGSLTDALAAAERAVKLTQENPNARIDAASLRS